MIIFKIKKHYNKKYFKRLENYISIMNPYQKYSKIYNSYNEIRYCYELKGLYNIKTKIIYINV